MAKQFWSDNSGTWAVETDGSGVVTGACGPLDYTQVIAESLPLFEYDAEEGRAVNERADEFRLEEPETVVWVHNLDEFDLWVDPDGEMDEHEIEALRDRFAEQIRLRLGWAVDWEGHSHSSAWSFAVCGYEIDQHLPDEAAIYDELRTIAETTMDELNQWDWLED